MNLIQTDQINCYNPSGRIIPCTKTGQDGDTRTGTQWPCPRFIQKQDIIEDLVTGLIWPQNAALNEFPLSWQEAFDFINDMNKRRQFGLDHWRLPRRDELFSLISHSRVNPAVVSPDQFQNLFNGYYWTATRCARYPNQAWYIHMGGGRIVKGMIQSSYMAWPVNDPAAGRQTVSAKEIPGAAEIRFKVSDHTVSDMATGLTWMRNADIIQKPVKWGDALSTIQRINAEKHFGFNDWRLPNVRELESLTDMTVHSPAVAARKWFFSVQSFYWSSTTSVYEPSYAWTLYTEDGNIGVGFKDGADFHVWPVRTSERQDFLPEMK